MVLKTRCRLREEDPRGMCVLGQDIMIMGESHSKNCLLSSKVGARMGVDNDDDRKLSISAVLLHDDVWVLLYHYYYSNE